MRQPCPFCGSTVVNRAVRYPAFDDDFYYVSIECLACHARGPESTQFSNEDALWDRRPTLFGNGNITEESKPKIQEK